MPKVTRIIIGLECSECGQRNYTTTKNKMRKKDKLTSNKFCKWCGKYTKHKEIKV